MLAEVLAVCMPDFSLCPGISLMTIMDYLGRMNMFLFERLCFTRLCAEYILELKPLCFKAASTCVSVERGGEK